MDYKRIANFLIQELKAHYKGCITEVLSSDLDSIEIRVVSDDFKGIGKPARFKQLATLCYSKLNSNEKIFLSFEAWTKQEFSELQKDSTDNGNGNSNPAPGSTPSSSSKRSGSNTGEDQAARSPFAE